MIKTCQSETGKSTRLRRIKSIAQVPRAPSSTEPDRHRTNKEDDDEENEDEASDSAGQSPTLYALQIHLPTYLLTYLLRRRTG